MIFVSEDDSIQVLDEQKILPLNMALAFFCRTLRNSLFADALYYRLSYAGCSLG